MCIRGEKIKKIIRKNSVFVIIYLALASYISSSFGVEPTAVLSGETHMMHSLFEKHAKAKPSLDFSSDRRIYLATFGTSFLGAKYGSCCGLSSTRIAIAQYFRGRQNFLTPCYVLEFCPKKIDKLPESIKFALAKCYNIKNLQGIDLFNELQKKGVEDIFITASAFGLDEIKGMVPNFDIIPHGFVGWNYSIPDNRIVEEDFYQIEARDERFEADVLIGLFDSCGVVPGVINPIRENNLTEQHLSFHGRYTDDMFTCRFSDSAIIGSFYIVVVAQKRILISQVLVVNQKSISDEIARIFLDLTSFKESLKVFMTYSKTLHAYQNSQALAHTFRSVASLSGNDDIQYQYQCQAQNSASLHSQAYSYPEESFSTGLEESYNIMMKSSLINSEKIYEMKGPGRFVSPGLFPVEKDSTFEISGQFRSTGSIPSLIFIGLSCYNEEKQLIPTHSFRHIEKTETKLVRPCTSTDKVIVVEDASNWKSNTSCCIAFNIDDSGQYGDIPNFETSSFGIGKIVGSDHLWEIHLLREIGKKYSTNTKIREHISVGGYLHLREHISEEEYLYYGGRIGAIVPNAWTKYTSTIGIHGYQGFYPKTKYMKIFILGNYGQNSASVLDFKDIELKQIF